MHFCCRNSTRYDSKSLYVVFDFIALFMARVLGFSVHYISVVGSLYGGARGSLVTFHSFGQECGIMRHRHRHCDSIDKQIYCILLYERTDSWEESIAKLERR